MAIDHGRHRPLDHPVLIARRPRGEVFGRMPPVSAMATALYSDMLDRWAIDLAITADIPLTVGHTRRMRSIASEVLRRVREAEAAQ